MEKTCCRCKKSLSVENFKANRFKKSGLQAQCISCQREYRRLHYERNRKKYIRKAATNRQAIVKWWKEYKRQFACIKCGENHPACVQFHHHNDDKEAGVSSLVRTGSKERLLKEIAKCVPLCANCHAKEHWKE